MDTNHAGVWCPEREEEFYFLKRRMSNHPGGGTRQEEGCKEGVGIKGCLLLYNRLLALKRVLLQPLSWSHYWLGRKHCEMERRYASQYEDEWSGPITQPHQQKPTPLHSRLLTPLCSCSSFYSIWRLSILSPPLQQTLFSDPKLVPYF